MIYTFIFIAILFLGGCLQSSEQSFNFFGLPPELQEYVLAMSENQNEIESSKKVRQYFCSLQRTNKYVRSLVKGVLARNYYGFNKIRFISNKEWISDELLLLDPGEPYSVLDGVKFFIEDKEKRRKELTDIDVAINFDWFSAGESANKIFEKCNQYKILIIKNDDITSKINDFKQKESRRIMHRRRIDMTLAHLAGATYFVTLSLANCIFSSLSLSVFKSFSIAFFTVSTIRTIYFPFISFCCDNFNGITEKKNIFQAFCNRSFFLKSSKEIIKLSPRFAIPLIDEKIEKAWFLRGDRAKVLQAVQQHSIDID